MQKETLDILLVEDDPDYRGLIRKYLENSEIAYQVEEVGSGEECLSKLSTREYSIVILDYSLPQMNGIEVLSEINKIADIPVIMVTGLGDERIAVEAMKNGAYDYVVKSSDYFITLPRVVKNILERRKSITERRRFAIELVKAKDYTDAVIKSMVVSVIVADSDATIQTVNQSTLELLGYREDEVIGKNIGMVFAAEEELFSKAGFIELIKKGNIRNIEIAYLTKDGRKIPMLFSGSAMRGKDGKIQGIVCSAQDITKRKRLQEKERGLADAAVAAAKAMAEAEKRRAVELEIEHRELKKANKKLDELSRSKSIFISNVSHELRTPLATVKEAISQILEGIKGGINPEQKEFLALAYNNANRLSLLINNLLELSQIEAGKISLARRFSSPLSPARKAIENFTSQASKKGLILLNKLPDALPELYIDPERIEGVFTNLIDNAIKFTEEGSISIEAEDKENEVCFRVADTGPGIPAIDLDRIFDRYQRLKFTHLPEKSGIGLGLPIVKELVQLHKGRVWAESHPGEGTRISFTLPKYSDAGYFSESIRETIEWAKAEGGKFFLIVIEIERLQANKLDESLRQMEKELKKFIRLPLDKILRFRNGKSLAIIIKSDRQGAQPIGKRIAQAFEKMLNFKIASFPEDGLTEEELLKNLKRLD